VAGGVIAATGWLLCEARNTTPRFAGGFNKMLKALPVRPTRQAPACAGACKRDDTFRSAAPCDVPIVDVLADLIFGQTLPLLNPAFELISLAVDDIEVVVGELDPLLLPIHSGAS
jgi:hypothetical protein